MEFIIKIYFHLYSLRLFNNTATKYLVIKRKKLETFLYRQSLILYMGRGSTQILIRKIIECLSNGRKAITDISKETGLDRTAIVKYLNILKESGLLVEEKERASRLFTIVPTYRTDTYFGLPLDVESEKKFKSLYHLIRKNWREQTTRPLLRTHAQKIAYKVITKCDLKVPFGWYIFGGIGIVSYDNALEYNYFGLPKFVEICVREVTIEYAKNDRAWQSKKQRYEEAGKELYLKKEEILSVLYSSNFDDHPKQSLFALIKKLRKLVFLAPKDKRTNYSEILDSYQDLMLDITNKVDESQIIEAKRDIIVLFESIWRYIALFNFKHDLLEFYSEKILDLHFKLDILQQEDEIIEIGTELQRLVPDDEITGPIEKQLHEALDNIKPLTPEEQVKANKEMAEYKKKYGLESLGKKLRKDFGF